MNKLTNRRSHLISFILLFTFATCPATAEPFGPITMPSGKAITVKISGNGVTGSVFLDNADYRSWLRRVFDAQVAEIESAAVAQVHFVNDVDGLVIRSISDLAGGQQSKNVENVFDGIASGTGAKLLLGLLDQIVTMESQKSAR